MRYAGFLLILCGCASNSGVIPTGPETYIISRQAATGFSGLGTLKTDALKEASDFCQQRGQQLEVISATEAEPPFVLGNFPRAEVEFRCVPD